MKKLFTKLFLLTLLPFGLSGQQIQVAELPSPIMMKRNIAASSNGQINRVTTTACALDTVQYPIYKATNLSGLLVNNATSASALAQYFNAPQAITVYGFRFVGWKQDATGGITSTLTCSMFIAGPDSLPMGNALATTTIVVDTNFGGGDLSVLQKSVNFPSPVTVTAPYVIVVSNPSPNSVALGINDYQAIPGDGLNEWLGMGQLGGTWRHGYELTLGPFPFDADVLIDPFVTYDLTANFSSSPGCVAAAGPVNFTNNSSPIFSDRMYNVAVLLGLQGQGVTWDFGDGTSPVTQQVMIDTVHSYTTSGNYTVTLTDTIFGWTNTCGADTAITLSAAPSAAFTESSSLLTVTFIDQTVAPTASAWFWDFGDGNTSTLQNPTHTYAAAGTYTVCFTITDACGTDSTCHSVSIVAVGSTPPSSQFVNVFPNPSNGSFSISYQFNALENVELAIFNAVGQKVYANDLGMVQEGQFEFSTTELPNGSYFLRMRSGNELIHSKLQILK